MSVLLTFRKALEEVDWCSGSAFVVDVVVVVCIVGAKRRPLQRTHLEIVQEEIRAGSLVRHLSFLRSQICRSGLFWPLVTLHLIKLSSASLRLRLDVHFQPTLQLKLLRSVNSAEDFFLAVRVWMVFSDSYANYVCFAPSITAKHPLFG